MAFTKVLTTIIIMISITFLSAQDFVPGEVLVKFRYNKVELPVGYDQALLNEVRIHSLPLRQTLESLQVDRINKVVPDAIPGDTLLILPDGTEVKLADFSLLYRITFPKSTHVDSVIKKLEDLTDVIYAEPNQYLVRHEEPDDPFFENGDQWYLEQASDEDIDAELAWDISKGTGIKIAIMDGGVRVSHNDIDDKITGGETSRTGNHGTLVAGVAGAETDNDKLMAGVGWNSSIIPYDDGGLLDGAISDINSAVSAGADILNMSWSVQGYNQSLKDALDNAFANGKILVTSAGNDDWPVPFIAYPNNIDNMVIAVSATNQTGNFVNGWNFGHFVDVSAPGISIYTIDDGNDEDYNVVNGTSFSAPIVSGIAALLKTYKPALTDRDIERVIEISAEEKGTSGWDDKYGWGRVNAYDALQLVSAPNELHHLTASGGSSVNDIEGHWDFYDLPGAPNGFYVGRRYEVRKTVSFGTTFVSPPHVWGRVVGTAGYLGTDDWGTNYGVLYCEPVPGSVTTTGATLRAYVYNISRPDGSYAGWYPCPVNNVIFTYTALGDVMEVPQITGFTQTPNPIVAGNTGYVYCNATGSNLQYTWQILQNTAGATITFDGNRATVQVPYYEAITSNPDPEGPLKAVDLGCTVSNPAGSDYATYKVNIVPASGDPDGNDDRPFVKGQSVSGFTKGNNGLDENLPEEFALEQNYPNPFNPSTLIRYSIPSAEQVTLKVYDMLGREVQTLVSQQQPAGTYSVQFDASSLTSGLYFYTIQAGSFTETRKMLLMQ